MHVKWCESKNGRGGEREEMLAGKPQGFSPLLFPLPPPSIFLALNFPHGQTQKNTQTETVATCMHTICNIDLGFEKRFTVV